MGACTRPGPRPAQTHALPASPRRCTIAPPAVRRRMEFAVHPPVPSKQSLSAEHWAAAALDALANGGLEAVAVEPLARALDQLDVGHARRVAAAFDAVAVGTA